MWITFSMQVSVGLVRIISILSWAYCYVVLTIKVDLIVKPAAFPIRDCYSS